MTFRPLFLVVLAVILPIVGAVPNPVLAQRGLLWKIVQGCLLNSRLTGLAFPCLSVETAQGVARGYAVIRVPNDDVHIIVTPTVPTIGIEAESLRGPGAPNYFQDAWAARRYVTGKLGTPASPSDIGMAINSRPGRSQDQLHIHVGCVRAEVKRVVVANDAAIKSSGWLRLKVLPLAPLYTAHYVASRDLTGINVFDEVASGLKVDAKEMDLVTIVVAGADPDGFFILARKKLPRIFDEPHGEALLDTDCDKFVRP